MKEGITGMAKHDKRPGKEHDKEHWRWNKANDGGARTDYDMFDWSGKQTDDHKDVRRKGSDR